PRARGGDPASPARGGGDRLPRDPAREEDRGGAPSLRLAEARGPRARARRRAEGAAPRRADGGHEHRGEAGHVALHPRRERRVRHHHRADRARHGRRHGPFRSRRRARLRQEDRRRHSRRGALEPGGRGRLPGSEALSAPARNLTLAFFALLAFGAVSPMLFQGVRFPQWLEIVIGGLMSGVLYSLVALGLVLIFKASGVFNFAQGAMVLFAALALVRLMAHVPFAVALALVLVLMVALAWLVERLVLRPLVNQEGIVLFMATLGIAYFLNGLGQFVWGADVYTLDVGM